MGGGGKSSTSTQTVSIPPEVLARYNAVNARAENVAQQPFQQYGGEFVAPLTPTQQAGIQATSAASQLAQPYYGAATQGLLGAQQGGANYIGAATGAALAGAAPVNPQGLQVGRYMNPFTQSVVGATQAALGQQQGQQLAQQQAEAIRSGAYGGDRAGLQRQALRGQQSLAQAQAIAPLYQQGYQQALQTAQQQQGVGLGAEQANRQAIQQLSQQLGGLGQQGYAMGAGASQQLAGLGTGAQQAALQGAQAQIGAGTLQQQTQQAQDTAQYQQFLQERGYPFQVAQFLANIAMGTGALSGSTTSTTQPRGFFSNRGGFKTGESLHRSGKAYGGGLDPNSMGGAVYEPGAFERGGYATSGAVVDSSDLAAILAQQRQSFGPFAAAGPYGQASGAAPHGPSGIVPQQQLATPKLITAGALPKQPSGGFSDASKAYSLADEATKGLSGKGLTERAGEKLGLRDSSEKIAEAKGEIPMAGVTGKSSGTPTPMARPDASELTEPGLFDKAKSFFDFEHGGGVMPRHRYADGGSEDSQADEAIPYDPSDVQGTKDPMEGVLKAGSHKPQMLKPAGGGGGGGGGGGFGDVVNIASKVLPFFLKDGGVVPRHGYQTAGAVADLPIDAEIVERAPGLDPNVVSELKREERRQAAIPQEAKGLASDPTLIRSESGGNWEAENKARGHGGMYGHFGRAQFGHARLQDAMNAGVLPEGTTPQQFMKNPDLQKATEAWHFGDISNFIANKGYDRLIGTKINGIPVTEQGMINAAHLGGKGGLQKYLESGGQYNPNDGSKSLSDYMAMGAGMTGSDRSGQGLGAGRPSQDVGRPVEGKAAEPGFFEKNKGIILPVLQGIGAMASSKSISPWAAALQGLGAGAKAYGDVEAQQAGIDQTKAQTFETMQRGANLAFTPDGKFVRLENGQLMPVFEWFKMKDRPMTVGGPGTSSAAAAFLSHIGIKPVEATDKTGAAAPSAQAPSAPDGTPVPGAPPSVKYSPLGASSKKLAETEVDNIMGWNSEGARAASNAYIASTQNIAQAAGNNSRNVNDLANVVAKQIAAGGIGASGTGFVARSELVRALNFFGNAIGGKESFNETDTRADLLRKLGNLQGSELAKGADQRSLGALNAMISALPQGNMSRDAQADLTSQILVANQAAKDREIHRIQYGQLNPGINAYSNAGQAFEDDNQARLGLEQQLFKRALLTKPQAVNLLTTGKATPEHIEEFFQDLAKKNNIQYTPGMYRYFPRQ